MKVKEEAIVNGQTEQRDWMKGKKKQGRIEMKPKINYENEGVVCQPEVEPCRMFISKVNASYESKR